MHPEWRGELEQAGAEFDGPAVAHFGNPDLEQRAALSADIFCDLSHQGLLFIHGEDARSFLQGQLTNDLEGVTTSRSGLGAYCNPQGRVIAFFRLLAVGDGYLLDLPADLQEVVATRLQRYRLMARVDIEDVTGAWVRLGCSGPKAADILAEHLGPLPAEDHAVRQSGDGTLIVRIPGPQPRYACYGSLAAMRDLWTRLDVQAAPAGTVAWTLLDIVAGIPTVTLATTENFLPSSLNLDWLGAVSFQKGCYPGQEIIARLKYRGTAKHRLHAARLPDQRTPAPGDFLVDADNTRVGTVVNACPQPDGGQALLAVLPVDEAKAQQARWPDHQAEPVTQLVALGSHDEN